MGPTRKETRARVHRRRLGSFPGRATRCNSVGEGRPEQGTRGGSDNGGCPEKVSWPSPKKQKQAAGGELPPSVGCQAALGANTASDTPGRAFRGGKYSKGDARFGWISRRPDLAATPQLCSYLAGGRG